MSKEGELIIENPWDDVLEQKLRNSEILIMNHIICFENDWIFGRPKVVDSLTFSTVSPDSLKPSNKWAMPSTLDKASKQQTAEWRKALAHSEPKNASLKSVDLTNLDN